MHDDAMLRTCYQTWFSWNHQHRRARVRAALTSSPRVLQVSTHKAVRLTVDSKFKFGSPDPYAALLTQHSTIHTAVQKVCGLSAHVWHGMGSIVQLLTCWVTIGCSHIMHASMMVPDASIEPRCICLVCLAAKGC